MFSRNAVNRSENKTEKKMNIKVSLTRHWPTVHKIH